MAVILESLPIVAMFKNMLKLLQGVCGPLGIQESQNLYLKVGTKF